MGKLTMFEFICYNEEEIVGEEYVVSYNEVSAKNILEEQMAKDDLTFDDFSKIDILKMDSRKSIHFVGSENPIKAYRYIKENNKEHFVGSTAPEMGTLGYMLFSKRVDNGFEGIPIW